MKTNSKHEGVTGIYCIRNLINGKVYIGKSINIRQRVYNHIGGLRSKDPKRENQHFINAWWKYGSKNFEYFVIEIIDKNLPDFENFIKERELYWITQYNSIDRNFGYNLRRDSSTKMIIVEETREKYKIRNKLRFQKQEERDKVSRWAKKFWSENLDKKEQMKKKVSDKHTKYKILQYSKDGLTLIKTWNKVKDIIKENPSYKTHNIYSVCSGAKPTIYGFKWVKILNDDIVQTKLKDLD